MAHGMNADEYGEQVSFGLTPVKLRIVTLRLPDTSDPKFQAEYRRQMAAVSHHDRQTNFSERTEPDESDLLGWV